MSEEKANDESNAPETTGKAAVYHDPQTRKFAKGNPGKPKGARVKHGARIGDMVARALDEAGGVSYLVECALDPKTRGSFLSLVAKLMPAVRDLGEGSQATLAALVEASYRGRSAISRDDVVDADVVDSASKRSPGHLSDPGRPA